jgi:hypothetical protein
MCFNSLRITHYGKRVLQRDGEVKVKIPSLTIPLRIQHYWHSDSQASKFERAVKVGGDPLKNKTLSKNISVFLTPSTSGF